MTKLTQNVDVDNRLIIIFAAATLALDGFVTYSQMYSAKSVVTHPLHSTGFPHRLLIVFKGWPGCLYR
jgi:hypothetical protein